MPGNNNRFMVQSHAMAALHAHSRDHHWKLPCVMNHPFLLFVKAPDEAAPESGASVAGFCSSASDNLL
jgi:hypothetical protein